MLRCRGWQRSREKLSPRHISPLPVCRNRFLPEMDFVFFDAKKTPIIIIYIDYFYSLTDAFRRCHDADDQYHGHYQNSYLENVRKDQNPLVLTSMMIVVGVQMAVMTKWPLVVSGQWTWMKFRWNFNEVTLSLWTAYMNMRVTLSPWFMRRSERVSFWSFPRSGVFQCRILICLIEKNLSTSNYFL